MAEARPPDASHNWGAIVIFLFSNGQEYSPPRKYHLSADELNWWETTLSHLARTQYGGAKMHKTVDLYTLNGKKIQSPMELRDGVTYVAVSPNEKFVNAGYEQYLIKANRAREKREARKAAGLNEEGSDEEDTAVGPSTNTYRQPVDLKIPTSSYNHQSLKPSANECHATNSSLGNRANVSGPCCSCFADDASFYNNIDNHKNHPHTCSTLPTGCHSDLPSLSCPKPVLPPTRQGVQDSSAMLVIRITSETITYNSDYGTDRRQMTNVAPERKVEQKMPITEKREIPNLVESERRTMTNAASRRRQVCNPCNCPIMESQIGSNNHGTRGAVADVGRELVLCGPCNDPTLAQVTRIRSNEVPMKTPMSTYDPRIEITLPQTNIDAGEWTLCSPCNDHATSSLKPYDIPQENPVARNDPQWHQKAYESENHAAYIDPARRQMAKDGGIRPLRSNEVKQKLNMVNEDPRSIAMAPTSGNMTNNDPAKVPRATPAWTTSNDAPRRHSSANPSNVPIESIKEQDIHSKERLSGEMHDTRVSQDNTPRPPNEVGVVLRDLSEGEISNDIDDSVLDMGPDNVGGPSAEKNIEKPAPNKSEN